MAHQYMHKITSWPLQKLARPPSYLFNVQPRNKFELIQLSHHTAKLDGYMSSRSGQRTLLYFVT